MSKLEKILMDENTIAERVANGIATLTKAEKRAARVLLARYPAIGLESVTAFAEQAKVSAPSVLRFIAKLGFSGYPDFRRALRQELDETRRSRLTLPRSTESTVVQSKYSDELAAVVKLTLKNLDFDAVINVVEMFADERSNVYILGGTFTETAARHLFFHLRKMRGGVSELPADLNSRADCLAFIGKRDLVVLFDIRRYQRDVVATARLAIERGSTVVLFTDQWLSEAAEMSSIVFRAKVDTSSPWDSLLGLIAIVETICAVLDKRLWSRVRPRLETIEKISEGLIDRREHTPRKPNR